MSYDKPDPRHTDPAKKRHDDIKGFIQNKSAEVNRTKTTTKNFFDKSARFDAAGTVTFEVTGTTDHETAQRALALVAGVDAVLTRYMARTDERISELEQRSRAAEALVSEMSAELHHAFLVAQLGGKFDEVPARRYLSYSMYISNDDDEIADGIRRALGRLIESFDLEPVDESPVVRGSIFQRFLARTKDNLTTQEMQDRLKKLERAAEVAALIKPQAEADKLHAEAIGEVTRAMEKADDAAIHFGSTLFLKLTDPVTGKVSISAKTLSTLEQLALEEEPKLLMAPHSLLGKLAKKKKVKSFDWTGTRDDGIRRPRMRPIVPSLNADVEIDEIKRK